MKGKIRTLLDSLAGQTENPEASREQFANDLATAIVDEIKELKIIYSTGLTAGANPVTGTMTHTVE